MNLPLNLGIDHLVWTAIIWAGHTWGGTKQTANQGPLVVNRAALRPKVYTTQLPQGGFMLSIGFYRQPRHLF
jgi:hypothetical protein